MVLSKTLNTKYRTFCTFLRRYVYIVDNWKHKKHELIKYQKYIIYLSQNIKYHNK